MRASEISSTAQSTYCAIQFTEQSSQDIVDFASSHDVPNVIDVEKVHCTVLYSKKPISGFVALGDKVPQYEIAFSRYDVFRDRKSGNNSLVMVLDCDELIEHHTEYMDQYGASWDFPTYIPHITLSYDIGDFDVSKLPPYDGDIIADHEYAEPLDVEWKDNE